MSIRGEQREVHAIEAGEVVGIYVGELRRAVSWARRANPAARLRLVALG